MRSCKLPEIAGQGDTESEIRDAFHLTEPGATMGPGGDMLAFWKKVIAISLRHKSSGADWQERLIGLFSEVVSEDMAALVESAGMASGVCPVSTAATACSTFLENHPREEPAALMIADAVLSYHLGWAKPVPLMALHLKRTALRTLLKEGDREAFTLACHLAIARAAQDAIRLAYDLARRAARLRIAAPKLRDKGSDFPTTMLSPVIKGTRIKMSDHATRRLCDRLVTLGVVKELTGRPIFRLFGVASLGNL